MVRVVIERQCLPGKELKLEGLLLELRAKAMKQRGYLSGETLRSLANPSLYVVISNWLNGEAWKVWETSPERREMANKIGTLLAGTAKVSILSFGHL